jgi:hypothetical protein
LQRFLGIKIWLVLSCFINLIKVIIAILKILTMRIFRNFIRLVLILSLVSCSPRAYFGSFVGTWEPLDIKTHPVVDKFQIEKRNGFYILGADFAYESTEPFFFVCQKNRDHLSISPGQYNVDEYVVESMLTQHSDIYYDKELNCMYFLNTIYIPSKEKVFEIVNRQIKIISKDELKTNRFNLD